MIDVLVFTYNNEDIIERCLKSIKNQSYKKFSCMVIDDASTDGTVELVKKKYPWVNVYKKEKNTGPTEGRNIGIEKTKNKYIAMLDSDVELSKDWLKNQVALIKSDKDIGIVGSKLLLPNGNINSAGGSITRLGFGFDKTTDSKKQEQVIYVCSAAWMMRRSIIEKIGFFDERFFYPHEDTDYCWRACIAGFKVVYNPFTVAYHLSGGTIKKMSKRVAYNASKNRIRSLLKNYEPKNILKYMPLHIALVILDIPLKNNRIAKIKGLLWNLTNIMDTIKRRKDVQKTRKVSDKELMVLFSKKWINEKV
ncbi:MAG: glycosyltransferase family 2 protein [Candidatus Aenigmatarchaeota archaeon]